MTTRIPVLAVGLLASAAMLASPAPSAAQTAATPSEHIEAVHHPGFDKTVNMPFVPAIRVASGKMLWLAGTTAVPVYHDHPHRRDEVVKHLPNDLEAQTRATMDGIKRTLEAAGATFGDVVHMFVFRTRPRIGDLGRASAVINSYFAPYNHKPTSTNVVVLELGEPEQLIEIQVVAVVD